MSAHRPRANRVRPVLPPHRRPLRLRRRLTRRLQICAALVGSALVVLLAMTIGLVLSDYIRNDRAAMSQDEYARTRWTAPSTEK
jgi:hypothetical protein